MNFDITWTITAVIAVSSFLSPIAVAIINNHHQAKNRKEELQHDEAIKKLEMQQQYNLKQLDVYYINKKNAYFNFLDMSGKINLSLITADSFNNLRSATYNAILFSSPDTQKKLVDFLLFLDSALEIAISEIDYTRRLSDISTTLSNELESTKPIM